MVDKELKKKSYVPVAIRRLLSQELREKLYLCFSKLYPDPTKEPNWYDAEVKRRIGREEVSQGFNDQGGRMFLKPAEAKLFYKRYVVPRMEGFVHEPLEEQDRKTTAKSVKPTNRKSKPGTKSHENVTDLNLPSPPKQVSPEIHDVKLVEDAVAFINEKANEALYNYSIEIGNYILEKFFNGNISEASSRNPRKSVSYRALCAHPELAPSPGALSVMLRVAVQEKLFETKKLAVKKLSYSHKAELVSLPDDETKIKLFKEAVKKSLSVRDLRDRVAQEKGLLPIEGSTQEQPATTKAVNFEKFLRKPIFHDNEKLRGMKGKSLQKLQEKVEQTYTRLSQLLEEYAKLRTVLSEIDKGGQE